MKIPLALLFSVFVFMLPLSAFISFQEMKCAVCEASGHDLCASMGHACSHCDTEKTAGPSMGHRCPMSGGTMLAVLETPCLIPIWDSLHMTVRESREKTALFVTLPIVSQEVTVPPPKAA